MPFAKQNRKIVPVVALLDAKYSTYETPFREKKEDVWMFTVGIVVDGDVKIKFDFGAGTKS